MNTVVLTRIDSGFSNIPPQWLVGNHFDGSSCLQHLPKTYKLPNGFKVVGEDIQDPSGSLVMDITTNPSWRFPILVSSQGFYYTLAEDED